MSQYIIDIASLYATTEGFYWKRIGMEMIASSFSIYGTAKCP